MLFAALDKAEPLISTAARQEFYLDFWHWPRPLTLTLKQGNSDVKTLFLAFDHDLLPTILTYNSNLAEVKVDPHAKNQGRMPSSERVRRWMDGQADGRMLPASLPASLKATRSITTAHFRTTELVPCNLTVSSAVTPLISTYYLLQSNYFVIIQEVLVSWPDWSRGESDGRKNGDRDE